VSCLRIDSVLVVDAGTERVKWLHRGFLKQHDPDFTEEGDIYVFDNNADNTQDGVHLGGSRIVAVRPTDKSSRVIYPRTSEQSFYTLAGGKAQRLPNGNLLITEAQRGRVFEVDDSGRTVWEWVHEKFDEEHVAEVLEGTRYPITPEQVASW
jgi:hypothetical protein